MTDGLTISWGPLMHSFLRVNPVGELRACVLLLAVASVIGCGSNAAPRQDTVGAVRAEPADILLLNGRVHTMDAPRSVATAVAIRGERIVAVGDDMTLEQFHGPATRVIDLMGKLVLPGFHDAHIHPVAGGLDMNGCALESARSVEALLALVRACVDSSKSEWLVGNGWDLSLFAKGNPSKTLLDAISTTKPMFLMGADGHSAWANSAALARARIDGATRNPPKGIVERDTSGAPSGTLRESAVGLVAALIPEATMDERLVALRRVTAMLSSVGITSLIEASASAQTLDTYRRALAANELPMRVVVSIRYTPANKDQALALIDVSTRGIGQIHIDAAKIFVDGVLEGETAALLDPYLDRKPRHRGELNLSVDELKAALVALDARGVQVHMHAIGDRAVRAALDAVQAARAANGPSDARHHIAHLQLVHPDDYPRFAALNVTANFQALWAFPDGYIVNINGPAVGKARVDRMYPIASLKRAGARIVGGSDWNVSSMNPLDAIQVALTRSDPEHVRPGVLNANERVDLDTMLTAYTVNAAWLMHQEKVTGTIEVGKYADLAVLDKDLFSIAPEEINHAKVVTTIFNGRVVYMNAPAVVK